jgi:hypothetical protein
MVALDHDPSAPVGPDASLSGRKQRTAPGDPARPGVWRVRTAKLDRWSNGRCGPASAAG